MNLRIVIADDHPIFLAGLRDLIDAQPDMEVVAAVSSGEKAVAAVENAQPDLLISDIAMNGINGIEAARKVRKISPATKILILSMHGDRGHVLAALDAGAHGYLLKESAREELIKAVRILESNEAYLSPPIANYVVEAVSGDARAKDDGLAQLTAREREVLRLIAEGNTTKQAAARLGLSPKTVSSHREHLMQKLRIHSVANLTRLALREGIVSDD